VALVEDHLLFAESLEIALGMEGYQVRRVPLPDRPSSLGAVLAAVLRAQPRIVLLDLDLGPHGNGVRLIEPLTKAGIAVVVVTGSVERTQVKSILAKLEVSSQLAAVGLAHEAGWRPSDV
jgi:DNA-binding NarL/FixJ family response regulator